MKIALVSPYDFAHPGGVINHIRALDEEFTRLGHDVASSPRPRAKRWPSWATVLSRSANRGPFPPAAPSAASAFRCTWRRISKSVLKREKFDVVHLHEPFMPMLCSAVLRFSNGINVGTFHAYSGSPGYELGWPFTTILLKRRNRKLAGRIAVSAAGQSLCQQICLRRIYRHTQRRRPQAFSSGCHSP